MKRRAGAASAFARVQQKVTAQQSPGLTDGFPKGFYIQRQKKCGQQGESDDDCGNLGQGKDTKWIYCSKGSGDNYRCCDDDAISRGSMEVLSFFVRPFNETMPPEVDLPRPLFLCRFDSSLS